MAPPPPFAVLLVAVLAAFSNRALARTTPFGSNAVGGTIFERFVMRRDDIAPKAEQAMQTDVEWPPPETSQRRILREGRYWWHDRQEVGLPPITNHLQQTLKSFGFLPSGRAYHTFVRFSAYRDNMKDFFVVGLTSSHLRREWGTPVLGCSWLPGRLGDHITLSKIEAVNASSTEVMMSSDNDSHGKEYSAVIVKCSFSEEVGGANGGTLLLRVPRHNEDKQAGIKDEDDISPVLHETSIDPNLYRPVEQGDDPRLEHKFSVCGAPMRANVDPLMIREWILWHAGVLEDAHFILYIVDEIPPDLMAVLKPLVDSGMATIVHSQSQSSYESWYYNQVLFINDCIHRSRHVAKWVLNIDYDEFLFAQEAGLTLPLLFARHEGSAALTFNRIKYDPALCRPAGAPSDWGIQRRAFRLVGSDHCAPSDLHCQNDGRSKWAANASTALVGGVHTMTRSEHNAKAEFVPEAVAFIVHLRRIAVKGSSKCGRVVAVSDLTDYEDAFVSRFADQAAEISKLHHWEHRVEAP